MERAITARIFDIQGYSVHDGPGGRTTIFFKGCPLRCFWCCNPEGLRYDQDVMYKRSNCVRCYRCTQGCPQNAISVETPGEFVSIDRKKCAGCRTLDCVKACFHYGYKVAGKDYTLDELMRRIERDSRFWSIDGGVTLTGGEVMMQYAFVKQLLARCKAQAIHTAIETSGYAPEAHYLSVLPDVDWIFTDIKHMDARQHLAATGVSNELILNNIRSIAANRRRDTGMVVRIPIITGFNDNEENASATADFVKSIGLSEINILPFHRLGSSKYEQLDLPYRAETLVAPQQETMERLSSCIQARGIQCYIGSNTPF